MNFNASNNLKSVVLLALSVVPGVTFTLNLKAAKIDPIKIDQVTGRATLKKNRVTWQDQVAPQEAWSESAVAGGKTSENNGGGEINKGKKNNSWQSFLSVKKALEHAKTNPVAHIDGLVDKKSLKLLKAAYEIYDVRINSDCIVNGEVLNKEEALNRYASVIDYIIEIEEYARASLCKRVILNARRTWESIIDSDKSLFRYAFLGLCASALYYYFWSEDQRRAEDRRRAYAEEQRQEEERRRAHEQERERIRGEYERAQENVRARPDNEGAWRLFGVAAREWDRFRDEEAANAQRAYNRNREEVRAYEERRDRQWARNREETRAYDERQDRQRAWRAFENFYDREAAAHERRGQ